MTVIIIPDDSKFHVELNNAGTKVVVVYFFATWCGPCHRMAPIYEELSRKYPKVVFLKVDVDQCTDTATSQGISAMPTFNFFRNKIKLAQIRGADAQALENKIKELSGSEDESSETINGHIDLITFINKSCCECLNESDDHTFLGCLSSGSNYLESDCDEQLIISIGFTQAIKLYSIKIQGPLDSGPKTLKLFINQPCTLDFDQADSMEPVQTLEVNPKDLSDNNAIYLKYVKFQNVQNLQIFVKNNQGGTETTRIDNLVLYGSPIITTNMGDFKRIAGKKGESH